VRLLADSLMQLRPGQLVGLCALGLLCLGFVMVNSADLMVKSVPDSTSTVAPVTLSTLLTSRLAVYFGLAVLGMMLGALVPVRMIARWVRERWSGRGVTAMLAVVLGILLTFCALAYVPGIQHIQNGAKRWIKLGSESLTMQPSEVAKWLIIPILAWYCTVRAVSLRKFFDGMHGGLLPALLAVGALAGFVVIEDLGTGVLIAAVATVIMLCAGAKWWHFALPAGLAAGAITLAIVTSDYRTNRVKSFFDPYSNAQTIGFQTVQGLVAIQNGQGVGMGLGDGVQKRGYLPEDRTDYIFAIICEELGIAGAGVVAALFIGVIWAGRSAAARERDPFLRLWIIGIVATIGIQATINLLVVTGMAPAKGIALPMVSFGGTGWILTAFCVGIVMAIDRTREEEDATVVPARGLDRGVALDGGGGAGGLAAT
jgi:cell division protein FtsW